MGRRTGPGAGALGEGAAGERAAGGGVRGGAGVGGGAGAGGRVRVRPIADRDWDGVVALEAGAYAALGLSEPRAALESKVRASPATCLALDVGRRLAGYLLALPYPESAYPELGRSEEAPPPAPDREDPEEDPQHPVFAPHPPYAPRSRAAPTWPGTPTWPDARNPRDARDAPHRPSGQDTAAAPRPHLRNLHLRNLHLHDLVVAEDLRGRGLGRLMLRRLAEGARRQGYRRISLVAVGDSRAFWAANGFTARETPAAVGYGPGAAYMSMALPARPAGTRPVVR